MKKAERKKQIKEVAIRLMSENGYTQTSIDSILREINYSKSGFYHCFSSKEELFKEILDDSMEVRYQKVLELKDLSKKEFFVETFIDKITDYNDYKKLWAKLMIEISTNDMFSKLYFEMIEDLMQGFKEFCKKNNFDEFSVFASEEINIFLNSLIVGVDIFNKYDDGDYKDFLRKVLSAYFEKYFNE